MNWEAIGAVGELVGALGVIGSLVYLARSIRHGTAAANSSAHRDLLRNWQVTTHQLFQNPDARRITREGLYEYDRMSDDEKYQFFLWMIQVTFQARIADGLFREGTVSLAERNTWLDFAASNFRTPGGRQLWEETRHVYGAEAMALIEARLAETEGTGHWAENVSFMKAPDAPTTRGG